MRYQQLDAPIIRNKTETSGACFGIAAENSVLTKPVLQRKTRAYGHHQQGVAALLITLVLVVLASLSALFINKAAITEQKLSGNDGRSKEVYAAAIGALEFGAHHLMTVYNDDDKQPVWSAVDADGWGAVGATSDPSTFLTDGVADPIVFASDNGGATTFDQGIDNYTPTVTYTLITPEADDPTIIEITGTATARADSQITKTVTVRALVSKFGTLTYYEAPPLVVENCILAGAVTGTPDIYSAPGATAIGTVTGDSTDPDCLDEGHFDLPNGGEEGETNNDVESIYETFFGNTSRATLSQLPNVIYVDANYSNWNGNTWNTDLGSGDPATGVVDEYVVLFFTADQGCPPINGSTTIWGLVFYDAVSCGATNGAQGGGGGIIYGTTAFSGDLGKFNANSEMHDITFPPIDPSNPGTHVVSIFPGSWKDW